MSAPAEDPAPPGRVSRRRAALAVASGVVCHLSFAAAVVVMIAGLLSGMTLGRGRLPGAAGAAADALLLAQFAGLHSALLTRRGRSLLAWSAPGGVGRALASTTFATVASWQVLALFLLWTPSGVVWWRAQGAALGGLLAAHAAAWLMLARAISDAGLALQTGWLGWRAVLRGRAPQYPPMPERGLFAVIRQPIYLAFALTTWTTPTWTPDQLAVALALTAYCAAGPILKERRAAALYGAAFARYRARTPYWAPRRRASERAQPAADTSGSRASATPPSTTSVEPTT